MPIDRNLHSNGSIAHSQPLWADLRPHSKVTIHLQRHAARWYAHDSIRPSAVRRTREVFATTGALQVGQKCDTNAASCRHPRCIWCRQYCTEFDLTVTGLVINAHDSLYVYLYRVVSLVMSLQTVDDISAVRIPTVCPCIPVI